MRGSSIARTPRPPRRAVLVAAVATVALLPAACGSPSAAPAPTAAPAPGSTPAPSPTSAAPTLPGDSSDDSSDGATDTSAAVAEVPDILRFEAPTLAGPTVDAATYAGRPVAFWFWAPG